MKKPINISHQEASIRTLSAKILEIDRNISKLTHEKYLLTNIIKDLKSKSLEEVNINPTEKRIGKEILTMYILQYLRDSGRKQIKSCYIYQSVLYRVGNLNNNSFRTHIMNMRLDGYIVPGTKKGYWKLPDNSI